MRRYTIAVNGESHVVDVEELSADTFQVRLDGQQYEVGLTDAAELSEASITPAVHIAMTQARGAGTAGTIRAPLPGVVVSVDVAAGAKVERGQTLVTLEAMKMRNSIRAAHDGVVTAVHVAAGDQVEHDAPLVDVGPR